jgi:hypothetical protein
MLNNNGEWNIQLFFLGAWFSSWQRHRSCVWALSEQGGLGEGGQKPILGCLLHSSEGCGWCRQRWAEEEFEKKICYMCNKSMDNFLHKMYGDQVLDVSLPPFQQPDYQVSSLSRDYHPRKKCLMLAPHYDSTHRYSLVQFINILRMEVNKKLHHWHV